MPRRLPLAVVLATALSLLDAPASLVHRWSFSGPDGAVVAGTSIPDSISGATAVVVGNGATRSGGVLTLPGSTNGNQAPSSIAAYVDLPNGILSARTDLTLEFWATPLANQTWHRLFDFGRMTRTGMGAGAFPGEIRPDASGTPGNTQALNSIMFALNRGTTANTQMLEGRTGGTTQQQLSTSRTLPLGTQAHIVVTYAAGVGTFAATGGRLSWFHNGTAAGSVDVSFRLSGIEDVNNWLGRSQWTGDAQSNVSFNEFRIYSRVLTPAEITASRDAGPDSTLTPPVAADDAVTLHRGRKALIPVLRNDTGGTIPSGITILAPPAHGTAVPDGRGNVLYTHLGGTAPTDAFSYTVSGDGGTSNVATVAVTLADALRIPSPPLNVPAAPPATAIEIVDAFPGLGFSQPLALATPPGETRRLFVAEKTGLLRVIPDVTATAPTATTFLNLPTLLTARGETLLTESEQGLLGVAFHPQFATNRHVFVFYAVRRSGLDYLRVSRFTAQSGNPNAADTASELVLIEQRNEASNHNGGDLQFGPDGYLYVTFGDEGGQNDQYDNSQRITKDFFSGILRIDVDRRAENLEPNTHGAVPTTGGVARYKVPADNPFVGATAFLGAVVDPALVRTEFWAVGLRNPWRIAFDPVTGELYAGDVGGGQREEVNLIVRGGNYGWAFREGTQNGPKSGQTPAGFASIAPLHQYSHGSAADQGRSITGGVVARGNRFAALRDAYVFGDYVSGNIWTLRRIGPAVAVTRIGGSSGVAAFGYDPSNADVLLANINTGQIQRVVANTVAGAFPLNLRDTGLFADLADLAPNPGLLPYAINVPFWSDHALKRRWFVLPDAAAAFTWTREGAWGAPPGAIWVKHFDIEMVRGDPASRRRLETRLLVRNATGAYGVSYRWNDTGTEATLAADGGEDIPLTIQVDGVATPQTWSIPSRAACMACHTPQAGFTLSFKTRQMNLPGAIHGFTGNQIALLRQAGYLGNEPDPVNTLPRHVRADEAQFSVAARARSYLEVNCAYCHNPVGSTPGGFDLREATPLALAALLNAPANNNAGNPANRLVIPGDATHSVLLQRIRAANGFTRMPPIATNVSDDAGAALVEAWITGELAAREDYAAWRARVFGSLADPRGEPGADPDGDAVDNTAEFLFGTNALGGGTNAPTLAAAAGFVTLTAPVPAGRRAVVETSTDLVTWTAWDVPGNHGIPSSATPFVLTGPDLPLQFFRLRLVED